MYQQRMVLALQRRQQVYRRKIAKLLYPNPTVQHSQTKMLRRRRALVDCLPSALFYRENNSFSDLHEPGYSCFHAASDMSGQG
jgi:hypothetical protein